LGEFKHNIIIAPCVLTYIIRLSILQFALALTLTKCVKERDLAALNETEEVKISSWKMKELQDVLQGLSL